MIGANWTTIMPGRKTISAAVALLGALSGAAWGQATGYSGKAYGTSVTVAAGSDGVKSGPTAASVLCTETAGISNTNSVTNVAVPPVALTGVVDTSVSSASAGGAETATAIANVSGVNLLSGLITADAVRSVSASTDAASGFSVSADGTTFTNAKVLGLPLLLQVAANTRIVLPGIGYVILNEQQPHISSSGASLTVNAVHVHINTDNTLGIAVGTEIVIAHAQSNTMAATALLDGFGYGTQVRAAGVLDLGRSADVNLSCTGGGDESNSVAGVSLPGILSTGAVHTTADGTVGAAGASAQVTATVDSLGALAGVVSAGVITAEANAATNGSGGVALSDTGSLFTGLSVTGHPEIGVNPAPNTRVSIAGLGTLWLHRVIQTSTSIEVRMVELVIDDANTLGLPIGADVRIAVAHAGLIQ